MSTRSSSTTAAEPTLVDTLFEGDGRLVLAEL